MIYDHQTISTACVRLILHQGGFTSSIAFAFVFGFSICMISVEVLVDEDTIGEGYTVYSRLQRNVVQSGDKELAELCSLHGPGDFR